MPDHTKLVGTYSKHFNTIQKGNDLRDIVRKNFLKSVGAIFEELKNENDFFKEIDYVNNQDTRTIRINDNPAIHLTFLFRQYPDKNNIFKIALEHEKPSQDLIEAFRKKDTTNPVFKLVENNRAENFYWKDWLRPIEIHYKQEHIVEDDFKKTLIQLYNRDWKEFCTKYHDYFKNENPESK